MFQIDYFIPWTKTSEVYKKVKAVVDKCDGLFPEWEEYPGIMTNDLKSWCGEWMWGCLCERKFAEELASYLFNYDIICMDGEVVDVNNSNYPEVAKLVVGLRDMAKYFKPWNKVSVSDECAKKIREWIREGEEHEDYSLVQRIDYMRWIAGGHNCAQRELDVYLRVDGDHALFFHHDLFCGGIVFHGYSDEGKYQTNGSVMLCPQYGWQQHT